jgi:adenylosuccinate lyase
LTRGKNINKENIQEIILSLDLPKDDRNKLIDLTPEMYIGLSPVLAKLR